MNKLSQLRSKLFEQKGIADRFICNGCTVTISKNWQINIDEEYIGDANSLEEARVYAHSYIENKLVIEDNPPLLPEEKIVGLIKKHYDLNKITDTLVESYVELITSNAFTVDPVVTELKEQSPINVVGKLEYTLNDGSVVAISEQTQQELNTLLKNKYEIVDYMQESKANFMYVISKLKE